MTQNNDYSVRINSEIGELEAVIIHSMGSEVENMTPENAERALYSDILNLSVAQTEYFQFREVLRKTTKVSQCLRQELKIMEGMFLTTNFFMKIKDINSILKILKS